MIASSAWQHRRFLSTLQTDSLPPQYSTHLSLVLALLMVVSGIALALYLASASQSTERGEAPTPASTQVLKS
jgi:hypothetical protein